MKQWKIAIVGSGYMAKEHARAFASLSNVNIVGICGRTRSHAEALAAIYAAKVYDSISELYEATMADVVVVAVNELSSREVCLATFAHPWLCFLEKPVGIDLKQAEDITFAARRARARVFVALNRRSYASTRHALRELAIDDGPRLVSVLDQQDVITARNSGQPEEVVRNYMFANSIHLIDCLNLFCRGDIVSVEPTQRWDADLPGYVVATVGYASGDVGVYQAVWNGPGPWSISITNPQVRLEMRPLERLGIQRQGERRLIEVPADTIDTEFKPGLRYQAEQIIEILEGGPSSLAMLDEATRSMALCAEIYGLSSKNTLF